MVLVATGGLNVSVTNDHSLLVASKKCIWSFGQGNKSLIFYRESPDPLSTVTSAQDLMKLKWLLKGMRLCHLNLF